MEPVRQDLRASALAVLLAACAGCGGASSSVPPSQHPPSADFAVAVSSPTVSVSQGATSSPVNVSVTAENGFTGAVQITISGLPPGITSNPPSPFGVAAGGNTSVIFGAASNASTGDFHLTAQASSDSLSHSASLALTVNAAQIPPMPRSTYVRTDSVSSLDDPPGEPPHRHIAYDSASKRIFVANRAMNRVEVFSSVDQTRVAQIPVPGASSVDLSADGATVWIGTLTEQAVAIDPATLRVKSRHPILPLSPIPNASFDRPEELLAMNNAKIMMRLRQSATPQALLALWDPVTNSVTNLTSLEPQLFQNGLGAMARTGNRARLLVAAADSSGELALFDSTGSVIAGPRGLGSGTIPRVAANADGSRFAVQFVSNGVSQLFLLDAALNAVAPPISVNVRGLAFSRDGRLLYVSEISGVSPRITVFDASLLQSLGQVPDISVQGLGTEIEEADETQLLFGISNRGVSFIDASHPAALPSLAPTFASSPVVAPSEGPFVGGTATLLAGRNFESTAQLKFGTQFATSATVSSATQIQSTSPPSLVSGAVHVAAYFPSGWLALAPDAFSYGPQLVKILPNAASNNGGDATQLYGYGFGSDAGKISVKIGGATGVIQKIENVTAIAASLGFDSSYPFPLERITVQLPAGNPGKADIIITSSAGSTTASNAFQYLQSVQTYTKAGLYKFLLYDQRRQWIYLSNTDHLDVFDVSAGQFHPNGLYPPGGPPAAAALRGLSLTPDGSQIVVADFGAQKIYLLSPDTGTGTAVVVGGVAGFLNSGPARVAATSAQTVFVGMSGEGGSSTACASCLTQLNLSASPPTIQPAPQPEVTSLTGAPLVQGNAAGDHVYLAYDSVPAGPVGMWAAASPSQFTISLAKQSATDLAAAADGTMFVTRANNAIELRGADLILASVPASSELEQIPGRVYVPGMALHPSGALIYQPFLTGPPATPPALGVRGGIDILDARSGILRLRIFLPEPLAMLSTDLDGLHGSFLALDEKGQKIFAITTSGLTVVQLARVPLGIGTISPANGPALGGTTVTIRGSGFQTGATVALDGTSVPATFTDMNTLSVMMPAQAAGPKQIVITNPDGETTSLDAAFTAN